MDALYKLILIEGLISGSITIMVYLLIIPKIKYVVKINLFSHINLFKIISKIISLIEIFIIAVVFLLGVLIIFTQSYDYAFIFVFLTLLSPILLATQKLLHTVTCPIHGLKDDAF